MIGVGSTRICPHCTNCDVDENGLIKEQETVVRYKDCKNNNQCSIQFKFSDADDPDNWFCVYGKRK